MGVRASVHILGQEEGEVLSVPGPPCVKGSGPEMNFLLDFLVEPSNHFAVEKFPFRPWLCSSVG